MPEKTTTHQHGFPSLFVKQIQRTGRRSELPLLLLLFLLSGAATTKTTKLAVDKLIWIRLDHIAAVLSEAHKQESRNSRGETKQTAVSSFLHI